MSMTREQLLKFMEVPSTLNERTLGELREILDEFPYFQTAHLLYVKNLQIQSNFRFDAQLKSSALHTTSRQVLYDLIHPEKEDKPEEPRSLAVRADRSDVLPAREEDILELTDEQLSSEEEGAKEAFEDVVQMNPAEPFDLLSFENTERPYLLEGAESVPDKSLDELAREIGQMATRKENQAEPNDSGEDLIRRFIQDSPSLSIKRSEPSELSDRITKSVDREIDSDEFITETLARIYVKQGLYQKAIKAFQRLSLKYPEKSVYFARQIDEVTNLLNK